MCHYEIRLGYNLPSRYQLGNEGLAVQLKVTRSENVNLFLVQGKPGEMGNKLRHDNYVKLSDDVLGSEKITRFTAVQN